MWCVSGVSGQLIACQLQRNGRRSVMICAGMLALFAAAGLALLPRVAAMADNAYEAPLYRDYSWWVGVTAALALAGSLSALWQARRSAQAGTLLLAVTAFMAGQMLMLGHEPLGRYAAGVDHLPALRAALTPATKLYVVGKGVWTLDAMGAPLQKMGGAPGGDGIAMDCAGNVSNTGTNSAFGGPDGKTLIGLLWLQNWRAGRWPLAWPPAP